MEYDVFLHSATSAVLRTLAQHGYVKEVALERALTLAGYRPNRRDWLTFINYLFLLLGAGLCIAGVIFFFAYNWADLHRFVKLSILEVAVAGAALLAFAKGLNSLVGKVSLTAASLLVGGLLAVYGQVYQTGADSYQLFVAWAALITVWTMIGCYGPLWLTLLALVNISITLYGASEIIDESLVAYALFGINGAALIAWEYGAGQGVKWLQARWTPRLIAAVTLLAILTPTVNYIFDDNYMPNADQFLFLSPLLFIAFMIVCVITYTRHIRDLFILTLCTFAIIITSTSAAVRLIDFSLEQFIFLSFLVIGEAALSVMVLRHISRSWEHAS